MSPVVILPKKSAQGEPQRRRMCVVTCTKLLYVRLITNVLNTEAALLWTESKLMCNLMSNPKILSLSALITCNVMKWPGGAALSCLHRLHHWLMSYTFGLYIVNVQWSRTSDEHLSIFNFGIRVSFLHVIVKCYQPLFQQNRVFLHFSTDTLV